MASLRREGRKRIVKRGRRASKPARQPRALDRPDLDQGHLATRTYHTVEQAMAYLGGFPSKKAFWAWATRRGIPKCRVNGLRFLRRDLDEAVQPGGKVA